MRMKLGKSRALLVWVHLVHTSGMNDTFCFVSDEAQRLQQPFSNLWNNFHITDVNFKRRYLLACVPVGDWNVLKEEFRHSIQLFPECWSLGQVWKLKRLKTFFNLACLSFCRKIHAEQRDINVQGLFSYDRWVHVVANMRVFKMMGVNYSKNGEKGAI